jgi:hypothetical protein
VIDPTSSLASVLLSPSCFWPRVLGMAPRLAPAVASLSSPPVPCRYSQGLSRVFTTTLPPPSILIGSSIIWSQSPNLSYPPPPPGISPRRVPLNSFPYICIESLIDKEAGYPISEHMVGIPPSSRRKRGAGASSRPSSSSCLSKDNLVHKRDCQDHTRRKGARHMPRHRMRCGSFLSG